MFFIFHSVIVFNVENEMEGFSGILLNGEGFIKQLSEFVINLCDKKDPDCYNVQGQKVGY
ncbi:hypothetical protein MASR1M107_09150 [Ignavibacteriales bacterium]